MPELDYDRLAGGRLIPGIGIATDVPDIRAGLEASGMPLDRRVGRPVGNPEPQMEAVARIRQELGR
jgi:hypothetical protein